MSLRRSAARWWALGLVLLASAQARGRGTHGPDDNGFWPHPARHARDFVQRSVRAHGGVPRWDRIRDLYLVLTRRHLSETGAVLEEQRERHWILKGRRPRVRIERPRPGELIVLGLDGRRAWVTRNGARIRSERAYVEAEEHTRRAAFMARLPFVLGEKDARSRVMGSGRSGGRDTVVVAVDFVGGTRPILERVHAHLDASSWRLRELHFLTEREPGARWIVELSRGSMFRGVWIPLRRVWRRQGEATSIEEQVHGIRLDTRPPPYLFKNPQP